MRTSRYLCAAALAVAAVSSAKATLFHWSVGSGGNGHYYEWVNASVDWAGANNAATLAGGYLVTITSAAEQAFVTAGPWADFATVSGTYPGPWIGAIQPAGSIEPAGGWLWVNGEGTLASTYSNWAPGEPNDAGGEEAGHLWNFNTTWNDLPVGYVNPAGYIVEYNINPVPEPEEYAAMAAAGLVGFGLFRRFRRNRG